MIWFVLYSMITVGAAIQLFAHKTHPGAALYLALLWPVLVGVVVAELAWKVRKQNIDNRT